MHKLTTNCLENNQTPPPVLIPPASLSGTPARKKCVDSIPLDNNTVSASNPPKHSKKRKLDVWNLLSKAKKLATAGARVLICQTVQHQAAVFTNGKTKVKVSVQKAITGRHSFGNLYCCRNVWGCPMCAMRTARKRGMDILKALRKHHENGGQTYLITYTIQHQKQTSLRWLLDTLRGATRKLKSGRWYQDVKQNVIGTISGLEVTYGENGYHPHLHEIVFTRAELTPAMIDDWRNRYKVQLETLGGYVNDYGIDIRPCDASEMVASYITKEVFDDKGRLHLQDIKYGKIMAPGADFEITGEQSKDGVGLSQWEVLALSDDPAFASVWQEYAKCLKGRRRVVWSRGLKMELLGEIDDLIDQEEPTETIATITGGEYEYLAKTKQQALFLHFVDENGFAAAYEKFLQNIKPDPGGT